MIEKYCYFDKSKLGVLWYLVMLVKLIVECVEVEIFYLDSLEFFLIECVNYLIDLELLYGVIVFRIYVDVELMIDLCYFDEV